MLARFFIDRPVFAWVIALAISIGGLLAVRSLPIEQYPAVAPPSLTITATYPGADAETLEENVTAVIEPELNGVEGFLYMASTSSSTGSVSITVTFESGTDIDVAQMEVQNRLSRIEARLPEEVRRQGIQVNQATSSFLLIVALTSPGGTHSALDLGNYANTRIIDQLRRVPGVGDVRLFGSEYAMRIWLDPERLASFSMSPAEALAAVQEQNSQAPGGQIGAQPAVPNQQLNATVITQRRLSTPEQFGEIILRANPDGSAVRLADVADVELGAASYETTSRLNGKPMAGMAVQLATGANALATARAVKGRMAELAQEFPTDMGWSVPYDSSPFIQISVEEVLHTLVEAMVLVFAVMYLFLQNFRATIIPTIVVPVALLGACLGLAALGYSINVLSLFAMVLAIGILVDDAIVVIENVERIMAEEGLSPRDATYKAMGQIVGAIIGITLVLVAVFIPMAFFPGTVGGIYRQFSVTLALSIAFSALLALTLTPALCATLLKPAAAHGAGQAEGAGGGKPHGFFGRFNAWFGRTTGRYEGRVARLIRRPLRWIAVFLVLTAGAAYLFTSLPGSFLPEEDQGYLISVIQAPPGATQQRTLEVVQQAEQYYLSQPQVEGVIAVLGFSFFGSGQNAAMMFVDLKPWEDRPGEENHATTVAGKAMAALSQIKQALIFALSPPAIPELGTASGFAFRLQDRAGQGYEALIEAQNQLLGLAAQSPVLAGVRTEGLPDSPQVEVVVDRIRARALGVNIGDINATLSISFGSGYANDFNREGRVLRVLLQAEAAQRMTPTDILDLRVRNQDGEMVPFSAFTTAKWTAGPPQLIRYNGYPAVNISGNAAPGYSTGEAMAEMERLARQLPSGFGYEWTGISYEEQQSAGQIPALLSLSILIVFLVLAALYESWSIPFAVILVVPLGVLGALLAALLRGLPIDVYFNVGIIAIIGLAAKNAILIVEFAKDLEAQGRTTQEATLEAVHLRFRPIIMTSLAFILGVLPLAISTGAGAASRIAIGTGVMGGMIGATLLGVFLIPVFFVSVRRWLSRRPKPQGPAAPRAEGESGHA
ncbi:efflux RND transporter permease subunit [Pedomonas mirosovicensis]|uniref:efflux RND transporter permease subunit n=1 Tax=Pedomonas mirosovicensis TaxID=2908641 RepID=UPI00286EF838|nr:efflux RND transporter permease subunit [Pedomonas mirosovicensis]